MMSNSQPQLVTAVIIGIVIALLSFFRQDIAAIAVIFSMLLSPELKIASFSERDVVIRLEDIVIITFFFSWLFKMAIFKSINLLKFTRLSYPILAYILIALFSTWLGIANGNVTGLKSLLYLIKYTEYFIIFFMFINIIQDEIQLKKYLTAFAVTAIIVSIYGFIQILMGVKRISAPFEGVPGEANTFGGYLLLIMGLVIMYCLKTPLRKQRVLFGGVFLFLIVLLAGTLSRASYLGFVVMLMVVFYFAKASQKQFLFFALLIGLVTAPFILPERMKERVIAPFTGKTEEVAPLMKLNTSDSSYLKVESTKHILELWMDYPLLGWGVTGVGIVDVQYPRILGEMGILGLLSFIWIIVAIYRAFKQTRYILSQWRDEDVWQWNALVLGYGAALAGLLIHGFAANTFVLVRIMEPFWFLTAIIVALPAVLEKKAASMATSPMKSAGPFLNNRPPVRSLSNY